MMDASHSDTMARVLAALVDERSARRAEMDASQSAVMERVLAALVDERSARRAEMDSVWEAISAIRRDVRRLAAQQDVRGPRPPVCDAAIQTDAIVTTRVDVGTDAIITARVDVGTDSALPQHHLAASPQTDGQPESNTPRHVTGLQQVLLRNVLQHLDCITLFRTRRVCRTWRAAVYDIVEECRSANAGRLHAGSAPTSDLHLRLLVTRHQMSALQAPSERGHTDLRIVAGACRNLERANLRGFHLSARTLTQLAQNNASSLREVILPAGVTEEQLEALLEPLKKLQHLTVSAPSAGGSRWLLALPDTLQCLDITGPGVTLPPQTDWYRDGLTLHIREVTDQQLQDLRTIAARVAGLRISDCPGVTAAGVAPLFAGLTNVTWADLLASLDGAVTEAALDGLSGCSNLQWLCLGENNRLLTDIPVAAVGRLAVTCQRLKRLDVYTTPDSCQAVLRSLLAVPQDIWDSDGRPRFIRLLVPGSVYWELKRMASGSRIRVFNLY